MTVSKGIGGAPNRASTLPTDGKERKLYPVASGVLDYFPDALVDISRVSHAGNEQHNPGQPLNWARGKSSDESDTMIRHYLQRGSRDTDGLRHSAKMAWRALAILQKEIEADQEAALQVGHKCPNCDVQVSKEGDLCGRHEWEKAYCDAKPTETLRFPSVWVMPLKTTTVPSQKDFCTDPGDCH